MTTAIPLTNKTLSTAGYNDFYIPECRAKITALVPTTAGLNVYFDNAERADFFTWFWLRDNSIDPGSLDQKNLQRLTDTFAIAEDIVCQQVQVDYAAQLIELAWHNAASTVVSAYVLASVVDKTPARHLLAPLKARQFWDKDQPLESLPSIDFAAIMQDEHGLQTWLEQIHVFGFCLVTDLPATKAATELLAQRIGMVQETLFGKMWEVSTVVDHGDSAYSSGYLEPHTDGTYYHDAAGLQLFNCLQFDGKGGESLQVDGFAIAEQIRRTAPAAFKALSEINVTGHYIEPGVHMRAQRPLLRLDAAGELAQVSFNNYDRAPSLLAADEWRQFHQAYQLFHTYANEPANWVKIPLRPGTALIFDNWRNLHGRMAYVGKRVFYGCYHSKATFESKLRVLQASNP